MKTAIKNASRKLFGNRTVFGLDSYVRLSWSQFGEDRILYSLIGEKQQGFYVDIGAHHPQQFSNTNMFYRKGWHGINVDPLIDNDNAFKSLRQRDINLALGVSEKNSVMTYYMFEMPELNGFDEELSKNRINERQYKLIGTRDVPTAPLREILDKHLPKDTNIDFLTVDVEGFDYQVLKSNDWNRYRPKIVVYEDLSNADFSASPSPATQLLAGNGYKMVARTPHAVFMSL